MGNIEQLMNAGVPVFFAFNHLYMAYAETDPRFKWINGTIAAEHAFKEFLPLLDSRTKSIMDYVPSPPIERLYKNVLEAYAGRASGMYKQLQNGAKTRDDLIHKPATPPPDLTATNTYLHQVEVAIFELYTFLYPGNPFVDYLLKRAEKRLRHVEQGGQYFQ
jgi:hypothetical protein